MKEYLLFIGLLLMCSCSGGFNSDEFDDLTIDVNTSIPLGVFSVDDNSLFEFENNDVIEVNSDGVLSAVFTSSSVTRVSVSPLAIQRNLSVEFDMRDIKSFLGDGVDVNLTNPSIVIEVTGVTEEIMLTVTNIKIQSTTISLLGNKAEFYVAPNKNTIIINNDLFVKTDNLSVAINKMLNLNSTSATISLTITPTLIRGAKAVDLNRIGYKTNFEIPLEGTFKNIAFNESFEAGLEAELGGDGLNVKTISYAILADNQFPLKISLMLYEADAEGTRGDPISDDVIIIAAADNDKPENGVVVTSKETRSEIIKLEGADADRFMEAEYLAFDIVASSKGASSNETIKLYKGYELKLRMVVGLTGDLIVDDL